MFANKPGQEMVDARVRPEIGSKPAISLLPEYIGTGVGRVLFDHAVRRAAASGAEVLGLESDPNAEGFYRRMGARRVGEISYPKDGQRRTLPLLAVDVRHHRTA